MHKVIALALSFALQAATLSASLVHAHTDDHLTDHHRGRTVHAHWDEHGRRGEPQRGRALAAADHDEAMLLSALVALATSLRLTPIAMTVAMVMATPSERPAFRSVHVVRSHDPPLLISLSPRAPPTVRLP